MRIYKILDKNVKKITLLNIVILAFLVSICIIHATNEMTRHHSAETDTQDYCLSVSDVEIGLSEINSCSDSKALQDQIITAANPVILIRSSWTKLPIEDLSFDFSKLVYKASSAGYPVTVKAPAINLASDSSIVFNLYVVDDIVHTKAIVHFANTEIADLVLDTTNGATLSITDIASISKQGFTFDGWYTDEQCTKPFLLVDNSNYEKQQISGNITLYPKWTPVTLPTATPSPTPVPSVSPSPTPDPTPKPSIASPSPITTAAPSVSPEPTLNPATIPSPEATPRATQAAPAAILAGPYSNDNPSAEEVPQEEAKSGTKTEIPIDHRYYETERQSTADEELDYQNNVVESEIDDVGSNKNITSGIPLYEFYILGLCLIVIAGFMFNISSDLRVLNWYRKKKEEFNQNG